MKTIKVENPNSLLTVSYEKLEDLQGDLKTLPEENLEKLKRSIRQFGFKIPKFVWIDRGHYFLLDGHQTKKALESLEAEGYTIPEVPYAEVKAKGRQEAAKILLEINSRYGEYNPNTSFFEDFDIDLDFIKDIKIPELDIMLDDFEQSEIVEDVVPDSPAEPLSKPGDLWLCGRHRVLCGDATKEEDVARLMDGKKADLLLTDPPYGMNLETDYDDIYDYIYYRNHPTSKRYLRKAHHYPRVIGDDKDFNPSHLFEFFKIKEIFLFGADYYCKYLPKGGSWIVWDKTGGHDSLLKSGFNSNFELIWSKTPHKRDIARITYKGVAGMKKEDGSRVHPSQKPVGLITWFFERYKGEIVVDLYLGSGTTLIAAEQTGRICYGCEIDSHYIDVILDRYAKFTGDDPIREDSIKWSELKKNFVTSS